MFAPQIPSARIMYRGCVLVVSGVSFLVRLCGRLLLVGALAAASACGGGGGGVGTPQMDMSQGPTPAAGSAILAPPTLSFTDTGLSVSDGVTRTGLWDVSSSDGLGWEYSLDFGKSWSRGTGDSFEVMGDGQKTIWVRARDDLGNTSEIVVAKCMLDTMAPAPVAAVSAGSQLLRQLSIQGIEPNARWEFSIDQGRSWLSGGGDSLGVAGNALPSLWLRQTDVAGNRSAPVAIDLGGPGLGWVEASGSSLMPTPIGSLKQWVLLHGEVVAGDADYFSIEIPSGFQLRSVSFVGYDSVDKIAFFAIQQKAIFDAGFDTGKMLAFGHFGPSDLGRNVVANAAPTGLGPGPLTFWVQQTGQLVTRYALLLAIEPAT